MKNTILFLTAVLLIALISVNHKTKAEDNNVILPSGDISGSTDTAYLQALIDSGECQTGCYLGAGNFYFLRQNSLSMINLDANNHPNRNNVSIYGKGMNNTILYMVGEGAGAGADYYLFHCKCADFTLKDVTIDGSMFINPPEQFHGVVSLWGENITLENVRGREIKGDTVKLIGNCFNCNFLNTEHINNGRSGISMRGYANDRTRYGGILIDGLYCKDVSDQCVDSEPGFEASEIIITNARVYGRDNNGLCMSFNGFGNKTPTRLILSNSEVYCKTYSYNGNTVIINNNIMISEKSNPLLIQKATGDVIIDGNYLEGTVSGLHLTVHNSGRPNHIMISDSIIKVTNTITNTGVGINIYDAQNVSISNVDVQSNFPLVTGVVYRDVISGIDRGFLDVTGVKVNGATYGIRISSTAQEQTVLDTVSIQGNHFRNVTTAVLIQNSTHGYNYIRGLVIENNLYGENVGTEKIIGNNVLFP